MCEFCTVDFEDAFHTIRIREEDRGIAVFKTLDGWAVFDRLCCGMAAAPLVASVIRGCPGLSTLNLVKHS